MQNLQKGDRIAFSSRTNEQLAGTFSHVAPNGCAYIHGDDGKSYERKDGKFQKIGDAQTNFEVTNSQLAQKPIVSINKRFDYLQQLVRMVINNNAVSAIITGAGGLGKSYTVKREIQRAKLIKAEEYVIIKGYSTAKGLYRTLHENNGKLIVFDDCDEILVDSTAKNLLKGALDSYDEREIHWLSQSFTDDLPQSFVFTGRVIFISNRAQNSIEQALISRSMCVDVTMSREDKIERMEYIIEKGAKEFMPNVSKDDKYECLGLIKENIESVRELSLRSLEKVVRLKTGVSVDNEADYEDEENLARGNWKEIAKYMLMN